MPGPEKDAVMAKFAVGEIQLLVAATVIEVGVNVPEATLMVIEKENLANRANLVNQANLANRAVRLHLGASWVVLLLCWC
mgnify:CR=1 FL=1